MTQPTQAADWEVVYVLANLAPSVDRWITPSEERSNDLLRRGMTLSSDSMAIAPVGDPRVVAAAHANPVVRRLLDVFVDVNGKRLQPAVLIARTQSPVLPEQDAVVAFRNCIALSVIFRSRASWLRDRGAAVVGYSDYFDFHPLLPGRRGLVVDSPAVMAYVSEGARYKAMPSPYVSPSSPTSLWYDSFLYYTLGLEWRRHFETPTDRDAFGRGLFRSLEIAYIASAVPTRHRGSMHEWGLQVAHWISAAEILVNALEGHANEERALSLLGEYDWNEYRPSLRDANRSVHVGRSRTTQSVNVVQHAYDALYRLRNSFLHGNEVRDKDLFPWGKNPGPDGEPPTSIIALAPIVYRTALHAYLSRRHKPRALNDWTNVNDVDPLVIATIMNESDYGDALQAVYGIPDDPISGGQDDSDGSA